MAYPKKAAEKLLSPQKAGRASLTPHKAIRKQLIQKVIAIHL
jgi:hypothetical protein